MAKRNLTPRWNAKFSIAAASACLAVSVALATTGCSYLVEMPGRMEAKQDLAYAQSICEELGYGAENPDASRCLLAVLDARSRKRAEQPRASQVPGASDGLSGIPMYPESSCIGPVIMGECKGTILHPGPPPKRCYGDVLNGKCVGPEY